MELKDFLGYMSEVVPQFNMENIDKKNKIPLDVQKAIVDFQWLKKKIQMLGDYLYDDEIYLPDGEDRKLLFDYYHALCAAYGILYQRISKMSLPIVDENETIMNYISDEALCGETFGAGQDEE